MDNVFKSGLICFVLAIFFINPMLGQGVKITPLQYQQKLAEAKKKNLSPIATIIIDTLDLPFFDDFAYDGPYPDAQLWQDNDVYVNNTFSSQQRSRGIATFDHLDSNGAPYNFLTRFTSSYADTLTSQCIDLKSRIVGMVPIDYLPADSIYLSFFVEAGGLGDKPENIDSLLLQFRTGNGIWKGIWKTSGLEFVNITQRFAAIIDPVYLHNAFQFRFINYVKNSGNMNHFHLDYIQINEGRSANDTLIRDVSMTLNPQNLLTNYAVMPYSHFLVNPGSQLRAQRNVYFRNNNKQIPVFATLETETKDHNGNRLNFEPFAGSQNINILAANAGTITYSAFGLNLANVQDSMRLISSYEILSVGNDATEQIDYVSRFNNNRITAEQFFHQYYAYDDGSAESGFALDYGSLPNGPGFAAMRFVNAKLDTLHGVDIHFNRALEDVSNRPINLMIWQQIANGTGKTDQLIRQISTTPQYVNTKNGFARFEMDTLILLPPGEFFIGWRQSLAFNINVGWDANYSFQNSTASNPNIFYNLLDEWEPLPNQGFKGVMMMRPLIGTRIAKTVGIAKQEDLKKVQLYPNPSSGIVNIVLDQMAALAVYNLQGKKVAVSQISAAHELDIKQSGAYICIITFKDQTTLTRKIVIK